MNTPEILFEDGEALVINKPAGLPVDRPRKGGPCLDDHLEALKLGFQRPPVPVHRLDTDTSGCLLLARNPKALKRFNQAFQDRLPTKVYLGILAGAPEEQEGRIELALSKISSAEKGWRMIPAKKGKPASSEWSVRETQNGVTLVEFRPETGRTHQLRVHAASGIGIALLGDPVYGEGPKPIHGISAPRTMLHASSLIVPRPINGGTDKPDIIAAAALPADFAALGFSDTAPEAEPAPESPSE